jgi:hypothetical protein
MDSEQFELGYLWGFGRLAVFFAVFFAALAGVAFFATFFTVGLAGAVFFAADFRGVDFDAFFVPGFVREPAR